MSITLSTSGGEFLIASREHIHASFGHDFFPATYRLETRGGSTPRRIVHFTFSGGMTDAADFSEDDETLRFPDGRVWVRIHDARVRSGNQAPNPTLMHHLVDFNDGAALLEAMNHGEGMRRVFIFGD